MKGQPGPVVDTSNHVLAIGMTCDKFKYTLPTARIPTASPGGAALSTAPCGGLNAF